MKLAYFSIGQMPGEIYELRQPLTEETISGLECVRCSDNKIYIKDSVYGIPEIATTQVNRLFEIRNIIDKALLERDDLLSGLARYKTK